ncbi:MAG TPA: dihydropteroate synthase [Caldimonas sp.]|jgi:dihydropteroate synthase|nr:dihydropteroate synthase [Caldimonas sp.]HEX4235084.1 dihydropteroate synthase [Caldimonas sp.]
MNGPFWRAGRFEIDLARPLVMAIVNVTPDSFADGEPGLTPAAAVGRCERRLAEGADILDIGGESSRPGAAPIAPAVELARVRPVLEAAVRLGCPVSIDTTKAEVMRAALDLGVDIVNDISALRGAAALEVVAAHGRCGVCLMHMRGTPASMRAESHYDDVVAEVRAFLRGRIDVVEAAGIGRERIVADPGIGFAKTADHNLELLARQDELLALGVPLLVGWSRKSTLARLAGVAPPPLERTAEEQARVEAASVAAAVLAVERGARIVRVHDVAATVAGLAVWSAARGADNRPDLSTASSARP